MERRELLIRAIATGMFPGSLQFPVDFRNLVEALKPDAWNRLVPVTTPTTTNSLVTVIVDAAIQEGWVRPLFDKIPKGPINKSDLETIEAELDDVTQPTIGDPVKEVLLDGTRPFAGRDELRNALRELVKLTGSTLLRIEGKENEKTGKTFSFYLAQHVARQSGYIASQFDVGETPDTQMLASDVIGRVGAALQTSKATGLESDQRAIGKEYADQVKTAIEAQKQRRIFVFDNFPRKDKPDLPEGTVGFIVRLVKYADAELRPLLRIVLIGFSEDTTDAIEDVAERDEAQGFTNAEMLEALKQIVKARKWEVSDGALQAKIDSVAGKSLRDRFRIMRQTIRDLAKTPDAAGPI